MSSRAIRGALRQLGGSNFHVKVEMSDEEWTLLRLGVTEPNFVLQSHLPSITLGRMPNVTKQCLGSQVSRQHLRLEPYTSSLDGRQYWKAVDLGSSLGTFVNGHRIPSNHSTCLNDRDVISLGGNFKVADVKECNKFFVFSLHAPRKWSHDSNTNRQSNYPVQLESTRIWEREG